MFNSQFSGVQFVFNSKNNNVTFGNTFNTFNFNNDFTFNNNFNVFNFNDNNKSNNSFNTFNFKNSFQSNQDSSIINFGGINFASDSQSKSVDTKTNNQASIKPEYTYDENGKLVSKKTVSVNGNKTEETITNYDANGNITSQKYKRDNESDGIFDYTDEYQCTYDANGNVTSEKWQDDDDADGKNICTDEYTYTYDENNKMVSKTRSLDSDRDGVFDRITKTEYVYDNNSNYTEETITTYDANGNIAKKTDKSYDDGFCYYVDECEYDEKGKMISANDKFIFDDGTCNISKAQYIYDENGNLISEKLQNDYNGDGIVDSTTEYECTCDKNGNVILKRGKLDQDADGVIDNTVDTEYTYDEKGNELTSVEKFKDLDGRIYHTYKHACAYDQDNRLISIKSCSDFGDTDSTVYTNEIKYTYDTNGNRHGQAYILTSKGYAIEHIDNLLSVTRNDDGSIEITQADNTVVKYDAYGKKMAVA